MIHRDLSKIINRLRTQYQIITLTGPRQSGKTTLLKSIYTDFPYVNLEDIDNRNNAIKDPRGFLSNFPHGAVIDEAQRVPELFSYIQGIVDEKKDTHFVLSGSQNFLLLQNISQSLAGRTAILKLMPFNLSELFKHGIKFNNYEEAIYKGLYPALYDKPIEPEFFYSSYINTYIEKDVRQLKSIENLNRFSNFVQLCAGRIGQLVNLNSLASDASISPNTAKSWLSILEASYIVYFLQPFHKNYNKRIIKSPKLYFYDTGLACSLLGLDGEQQVKTYYAKGALFENLIINEFVKNSLNKGKAPRLFFWQNKTKKEIDLIVEDGNKQIAYEIKSGMTRQDNYFSNLLYWKDLTGAESKNLNIIYGGENDFKTSNGSYIGWRNLSNILFS